MSARGQRIRIDTWLGEDLWPAMVEPSQVEAAILNLALNAHNAMPEGGVLTIITAKSAGRRGHEGRHRGRRLSGDHRHRHRHRHVGASCAARVRAVLYHQGALWQRSRFEPGVRDGAPKSGGTVRLKTSPDAGTPVTLLLPRAAEMPNVDRPQIERRRVQSRVHVLVADDGSRTSWAVTRTCCVSLVIV